MNNYWQNSLFFTFLSLIIGFIIIYFFRQERKKILAAFCAGFAVSIADFLGAMIAHKFNWWHVYGALRFLNVPLVLNLGWIFLGTSFCLIFSLTAKLPLPNQLFVKILIIFGTCFYGVLNDYLLTKFNILQLGSKVKIYYTFPYWLVLVCLTVLVFEFCCKQLDAKILRLKN